MVMRLRRRLSRLRDYLFTLGQRRLVAFAAPPLHPKAVEERIKSRVGVLNAIGLGLFASGVVNPTLATAEPVPATARIVAAVIAAALLMAAQRYLRYIPNPQAPKETDHV